jgi:hypothetical protein
VGAAAGVIHHEQRPGDNHDQVHGPRPGSGELTDDLHRVGDKEDGRGDGQRPLGALLELLEPALWFQLTTGQTLTVTGRTSQMSSQYSAIARSGVPTDRYLSAALLGDASRRSGPLWHRHVDGQCDVDVDQVNETAHW